MMKNTVAFCFLFFLTIGSVNSALDAQPLPFNQKIADSLILLLKTKNKEDTSNVIDMITLARMYIGKSDSAEFFKWAIKGENVATAIGYDHGLIQVKAIQAFYYSIISDWPKSLFILNEMERFTRKNRAYFSHYKPYINNLRFINYALRGDLTKAKEFALDNLHQPGFFDRPIIEKWPTIMQVGLAYEWGNQLDSAQYFANILKQFVSQSQDVGTDDLKDNCYTLFGNIARKKKDYKEAIYQYGLGRKDLIGLAKTYDEMNEIDSCLYYANAALSNALKTQNQLVIVESSQLLARRYEQIDPIKSNTYLKLYTSTKDELFNVQKLKQIEEIQLNEQRIRFDYISQKRADRNRMIQYGLLALAFILFISALSFLRSNKIKKQANEKLTEANNALVSARSELEKKNRNLSIESSLDKVRSRALEMKSSDEIQDVAYTMYREFKHLQFQFGACSVYLIDDVGNIEAWVAGFGDNEYPQRLYVPYFHHPVYQGYIDAYRSGLKYKSFYLAEQEKPAYDDYMFEVSDFKKLDPHLIQMMRAFPNVHFAMAYNKYGALHWGPGELNAEEAIILQKFSVTFEQAYTRFLDLQKAETNSREARIEAALEKIRSRSLAMHHSEELHEVMAIMFKKMTELEVLHGTLAIQLFDIENKNCNFWVSNDRQQVAKVSLPYDEKIMKADGYMKDCWQARHNGESFFNKVYSFEEKNNYFNYVFANNDESKIPAHVRTFILGAPLHTASLITEKNSSLFADSWDGQKYSADEIELLKRVAKVFDQAYIRFLDLQKAEAQAREAQIETSLERIRSKTLAMQSSTELSSVIGLIYSEMGQLEVRLQRCIFMIFNPENLGMTWWMATGESLDLGNGYFVPFSDHLPQMAFLRGWQEKTEKWNYLMQGKEKRDWDNYLFHDTELKKLPSFIKENMKSYDKIYLNASFGSFGCLTTGNEQPLNESAFDLLIRVSKVFELSYTRFNDLKIAEAQAEQARLDLLQIQSEKKRAEDALAELRITQAQLIQSEKLASLGELTAGIAHEIQNPLNFVNNFSDLNKEMLDEMKMEIEKGNYNEVKNIATDVIENETKINHHGKRAESIVKGMLEHSRKSSGVKEHTDINKLCDEFVRLSYHGLRAKDKDFNCNYKLDLDPNLPLVNVVSQDMGRVLLNIMNNAFQACHQKQQMWSKKSDADPSLGRNDQELGSPKSASGFGVRGNNANYSPLVVVTTKYISNKIEITISDNGSGIPDPIKDKIFQPFFTTKPTGQGTGLGLSLSYDIVKAHGGNIEVKSNYCPPGGELKVNTNEGEGSEFIIQLPI